MIWVNNIIIVWGRSWWLHYLVTKWFMKYGLPYSRNFELNLAIRMLMQCHSCVLAIIKIIVLTSLKLFQYILIEYACTSIRIIPNAWTLIMSAVQLCLSYLWPAENLSWNYRRNIILCKETILCMWLIWIISSHYFMVLQDPEFLNHSIYNYKIIVIPIYGYRYENCSTCTLVIAQCML